MSTIHQDLTAELKRQLAEAIEENIRLKAAKAAGQRAVTWKVSEKGAISIYGLGRFPVTLYKSQWDKLYQVMDDIELFRQENDTLLSSKD
jgi:citrate lyase gamma subunit